jgi:glycosyltransferase involved in cell wall biosynthesis
MVGIEVMRYGIPVVAFDAGGIPEWLKDGFNGFLVEWNNISQYAHRITQLLQDKNLTRKLGENAATFACEHFQFEQYIGQLESILTEMAVPESPN